MKRKPVRIGDVVNFVRNTDPFCLNGTLRCRYVDYGGARYLMEVGPTDCYGTSVESWKRSFPELTGPKLLKVLGEIESRGNYVSNDLVANINDPKLYKIIRRARKK